MIKVFSEIFGGLKSLFIGMRITIQQFFKPIVTVQYPRETLQIPKRFRGHIEMTYDPETGKPLCIACNLCERACPSDCIIVDGAKLDGAKRKSVTGYTLDFTKCSLCGACIEACHDDAIRFSREYNRVALKKDEFVMDLFKEVRESARAKGLNPDAKPAVAAPVASPAVAPFAPSVPMAIPNPVPAPDAAANQKGEPNKQ